MDNSNSSVPVAPSSQNLPNSATASDSTSNATNPSVPMTEGSQGASSSGQDSQSSSLAPPPPFPNPEESGSENSEEEGLFGHDEGAETSPLSEQGNFTTGERLDQAIAIITEGLEDYQFNQRRWNAIADALDLAGPDDLHIFMFVLEPLNTGLALSTEETFIRGAFPLEKLVRGLAKVVKRDALVDILVLGVRALNHLLTNCRPAASYCIRHQIVNNIIDILNNAATGGEGLELVPSLAEALAHISLEQPKHVLEAGALDALFSVIDFIENNDLIKLVEVFYNLVSRLAPEQFDKVSSHLSLIVMRFLNASGPKADAIRDLILLSFLALFDIFGNDKQKLLELFNTGMHSAALGLVTKEHYASLSTTSSAVRVTAGSNFGLSLQLLTVSARYSFDIYRKFLDPSELFILPKLKQLLTAVEETKPEVRHVFATQEVLTLANELLPALPEELANLIPVTPMFIVEGRVRLRFHNSNRNAVPTKEREALLQANPTYVSNIATHILPSLLPLASSLVSMPMRSLCLSAIAKVIVTADKEILTSVLKELPFSAFIARLLSDSNNRNIQAAAIAIAETAIAKLPDIFQDYFIREGVVHQLSEIIQHINDPRSPDSKRDKLGLSSSPGAFSFLSATPPSSSSPVAASISSKSPADQHKPFILEHAQNLLTTYFSKPSNSELLGAMDRIHKLALVVFELLEVEKKGGVVDISKLEPELTAIAKILVEGLSDFEFSRSGLITALQLVLSTPGPTQERRLRLFAQIFMESTNAFPILVRLLHKAIGSADSFPIFATSNFWNVHALRGLLREIPVILRPADDETQLRGLPQPMVNVEPLALVSNVLDYVKQRVQRRDPSASVSPRVGSLTASTGIAMNTLFNETPSNDVEESESKLPSDSSKSPVSALDAGNDDEIFAMDIAHPSDAPSPEQGEEEACDAEADADHDDQGMGDEVSDQDDEDYEDALQELSEAITQQRLQQDQQAAAEAAPTITLEDEEEIALFLDGRRLNPSAPLMQELMYSIQSSNSSNLSRAAANTLESVWSKTHEIRYKLIRTTRERASPPPSLVEIPPFEDEDARELLTLLIALRKVDSMRSRLLAPSSLAISETLRAKDWESDVLATKLSRQISDPQLVSARLFPRWCAEVLEHAPFVIPFQVRREYFRLTALGAPRALLFLLASQRQHPGEDRARRLPRLKVDIERSKVLPAASIILEKCSEQLSTVLDVHFRNEVGIGAGPTREFYSLVCREIAAQSKYWLIESSARGLYPQPFAHGESTSADFRERSLKLMRLVGMLVGKALLDGQLLDLPLAPQLLQSMVFRSSLTLQDLVAIKPDLGQRILELDALAKKRKSILADESLNDLQQSLALDELRYHGGRIEDLELDFATPMLLKADGGNISVTLENLEEYIDCIKELYLGAGIQEQVTAMREGFEMFLPVDSLRSFTPSEIDELVCGVVEGTPWTKAELRANTKVSEKLKDRVAEYFFDILSEFDVRERRQFLLFLTGCPRLPPGGWRSLEPKMQLQPKDGAGESSLPSVNTCFIFLKMPEYSSKEVMRERLLYAMFNGVDRFDLS